MDQLQEAYSYAKTAFWKINRAGVSPDVAFNHVLSRLAVLYPQIPASKIREIATLALI